MVNGCQARASSRIMLAPFSAIIMVGALVFPVVTAGMIDASHDVEIVDPDLVICTLDDGTKINVEMTVTTGKGYVPAAQMRSEDAPIGLIPIDAVYSPVRRVAFRVENTRVGQVTDYDKLVLDVETDGTTTPEDVVGLAARILQDQLQLFIAAYKRNCPLDHLILLTPRLIVN